MIMQLAGPAVAALLAQTDPAMTGPTAQPATTPPPASAPASTDKIALPAADLAGLQGEGVDPQLVSVQDLNATNTGNTVSAAGSLTTGSIALSGAVMSNFTGIGNFVFNTGNTNNLQGNVTVNIVLAR